MLSRTSNGEQLVLVQNQAIGAPQGVGIPLVGMPQSPNIGAPANFGVGAPQQNVGAPCCVDAACAVPGQCQDQQQQQQVGKECVGAPCCHLPRHSQPHLQPVTTQVYQLVTPVVSLGAAAIPKMEAMAVKEPELYAQTRIVRWNWRFNLGDVSSGNDSVLIAPFPGQASALMGIFGKPAPQSVFVQNVSLMAINNDSAVPMICHADWIPYFDFVTNCGQRGTFDIDSGKTTYSPGEYTLYDADKNDLKFVYDKRLAIGKTLEGYLADVVQLPAKNNTPQFLVKKDTPTFATCRNTYELRGQLDVFSKNCAESGFVMDDVVYNQFFGAMDGELKRLQNLLVPMEKLHLKLELMRPARSNIPIQEAMKGADIVSETIATIPGGDQAKSYYLTKTNTVSVTMRIQYVALH
jgi:hypothetical protein